MAVTVRKATAVAVLFATVLQRRPRPRRRASGSQEGQLRYVGAGEANRVQVARAPTGEYTIIDPAVRVRVATGCQSTGRNTAICTGNVTRVTVVEAPAAATGCRRRSWRSR